MATRALTALLSASPLALVSVDATDTIEEWNPAAERLLGWRRSETVGRKLGTVLCDEDGNALETAQLLGRDQIYRELRVRTSGGGVADVAVWSAPLRARKDRVDGAILMLAAIAERKRVEAERTRQLRDEAEQVQRQKVLRELTFLAEASRDLSSSLDLDATLRRVVSVCVPHVADWCTLHLIMDTGAIVTAARAAADPQLDANLRELQQRYPPSREGLSPGAQALRTGHPVLHENVDREWLESTAMDPEHLALLERLAPVSVMGVPLIAREHIIGAMTFASTTPERHFDAASLALAQALARRCALAIDNARLYQQAQDALRARETFLSVASHELGTPLARVKLHTEVLQMALARDTLDEALFRRSVASIERATNRLASITQDLIDVVRLQSGDVPLRPARVDLGKLVRQVVRGYVERVDVRSRVHVHVSRGQHIVLADPARIEQVCENLLSNALKYSPQGGAIHVSVGSENDGVTLRVRDQGIGIPPEAADAIFEPFGRASNAESSVPGMGLGLFLCRSIVERHGGRVWAESPGESKGATVTVWLPGARV